MKEKHAKYSPSSSHRWLECPGSIQLSEKCPTPPDSPQAKEGTDAHKCLEILINNGIEKQLSTERFLQQKYPLQMVMDVASVARTIWKMTPKNAELEAESKANLFHINKEMHGTSDATAHVLFDWLSITDFKYGKMPVEVFENSQLMAYAIGKAHELHYNFEGIKCIVVQPRAGHDDGPVRTWETTIDVLFEWEERFKEGIKATQAKRPTFKAGEHCFFCPAKSICKTYTPEAVQSIRSRFGRPTQAQSDKRLALDFAEF